MVGLGVLLIIHLAASLGFAHWAEQHTGLAAFFIHHVDVIHSPFPSQA